LFIAEGTTVFLFGLTDLLYRWHDNRYEHLTFGLQNHVTILEFVTGG